MKILLVIVYVSGGFPVMEWKVLDKALDCYVAGVRRIVELERTDGVTLEFARCVAIQATETKNEEENKNG